MPDDVVIKVENLSKRYRLGELHKQTNSFREKVTNSFRHVFSSFHSAPRSIPSSSDDAIWALRDVSFEVKRGEIVGIIGRNGAGKSTLLKILSRITKPTEGKAWITGRVGSLLEVGTGFHPELSGRENVFLNGAIIGMTKAEIRYKFDEIVDFAEVEKFIDTPVKRYSSGMYVRLAFAVAAHLKPKILLIDEVLAVGDVAFQQKCISHMLKLKQNGCTILYVSHNLITLEALSNIALVLSQGKKVAHTDIVRGIELYQIIIQNEAIKQGYHIDTLEQNYHFIIKILSVELVDCDTGMKHCISGGSHCKLLINYCSNQTVENPKITWHIWRNDIRLLTADSQYDSSTIPSLSGVGKIECKFVMPLLITGIYNIKVSVGELNKPTMLGGWGWKDEMYNFKIILNSINGIVPKDEWGIGTLKGDWFLHQ